MTNVPDIEARRLLEASLEADRAGDADGAFSLLQASVRASAFNPDAHHLLGADYAQRGDHARAVLHLATAVEQAPARAETRLQLGLLWLVVGNRNTAAQVLEPLARLPDMPRPCTHYANALRNLCADDAASAASALELGLAIGGKNIPLQHDMGELLARIRRAESGRHERSRIASRCSRGWPFPRTAGGRPS